MPEDRLRPTERSLQARIAAYKLHATHDSREITAPARRKFMERFVNEVDPDRVLPERERARRAECAKKAYFTSLSLESARERRKRAKPS